MNPVNSKYAKRHSRNRARHGAVLICVVACLSVVVMLLGGSLRATLRTRMQLRKEHQVRQALWLVEAGWERAAFRLSQDPTYHGETWQIEPESLGVERGGATITITVHTATQNGPQDPAQLHPATEVDVMAEYPAMSSTSVRRTRTYLIPLRSHQPAADPLTDDAELIP